MTFSIFILTLRGKNIVIEVEDYYTVDHLKLLIYNKENILPSKQRLIFRGKELKDQHHLSYYGIFVEENCKLVLFIN